MEEKKKSWFRRYKILTGILAFFLLFIIIGIFNGISQAQGETSKDLPASYEEAKQKSVNVSYEALMRYSESYTNKWVCFEGQIIQIISDIPKLELRIATKEDEWIGYWENVIYLYSESYQGERLLEEDLIKFCGKSTGIVTYEAVLGNQMSIPGIKTDNLYVKRVN